MLDGGKDLSTTIGWLANRADKIHSSLTESPVYVRKFTHFNSILASGGIIAALGVVVLSYRGREKILT